jgi:hypothetical protein
VRLAAQVDVRLELRNIPFVNAADQQLERQALDLLPAQWVRARDAEESSHVSEVTPIRRKTTRPPDCDKALGLLMQARGILVRLVENGQVEDGSPPDATLFYLDDAIAMLR